MVLCSEILHSEVSAAEVLILRVLRVLVNIIVVDVVNAVMTTIKLVQMPILMTNLQSKAQRLKSRIQNTFTPT